MTSNGMRELLETLLEISSAVTSLNPDLTDKKTISDVMLALEKIAPDIRSSASPKVARLADALTVLYEKFLMETIPDGGPGIECTKNGVITIQAALKGEKQPQQADAESDQIVNVLSEFYGINPPPAAPSKPAGHAEKEEELSASEGGEGSGEEDLFAGFDMEPKELPEEAPSAPADPIRQRLDKVASGVTMLEPDLGDKKAVADILVEMESLTTELKGGGYDEAVCGLAASVGRIYEKALLEGLDEGQKAINLSTSGIKALLAALEKIETSGEVAREALRISGDIAGFLGGPQAAPTAQPAPAAPEPPKTAPPPPQPSPAAKPVEKIGPVTPAGVDTVKVASDDDLLLYTEFVAEAQETVANVENDLLELEASPESDEIVNNLFRAIHSLKGAAGFLGINTINVLCHEAESLMDRLRKKTAYCTQEMIDAFLKTADVIKLVNEGLSSSCQKAKGSMPDASLDIPRYEISGLLRVLSALTQRKQEAAPPPPSPEEGMTGEQVEAEKLGDILVHKHAISPEQLEEALHSQKPLGEILVHMGAVDEKALGEALHEQEEKRKKAVVTALKVDTEKLDSLLELVGELVISQSIVAQDRVLQEEANRAFQKNVLNLGKITKNIQDHVMGLRMVQLKQTFQKMSRLIRDLSKKMGKQVAFHLSGEETEIDKTIIEELNDPLVHLLRNSMDHGVEAPEDRRAAGKSGVGNVWLSAYHRGGNVYIEVKDDGKGLDKDRILKKAAEKGLVKDGMELSEPEIFNLVFLPGFSTAAKVTDVSGRGVGMDVVRSNIDKMGGKVEITSKPGSGSTFTIKLPLTMAIVDGMIVRIGGERFIIPTVSIRESIRPRLEEISTVRREGEMINIRGRLLPLIRLHNILKVKDAQCMNPWEGLVIIVESDEKEYGLMVDDLLGQQQVVIKSLGRRFKGLPGISGGTILGDGRVGLILDVSGVIGMN
ncbi:MAG: chemotaxis protein CheA [Nitrospinae bacterium]|nr:chemotaxis protein CheA [Nitrospinota bacterium]